jgi:hypothetical protein
VADLSDLVRDLLEPSRLGVEQRVFDELQEKIGQALA